MLRVINEQDVQAALAVQHALPDIARAVDVVTAAISQGGRVFYIDAGSSGRLAALDAAECPPTFGAPASMFEALVGRTGVYCARYRRGLGSKWTHAVRARSAQVGPRVAYRR